jgi:hypothetical protein
MVIVIVKVGKQANSYPIATVRTRNTPLLPFESQVGAVLLIDCSANPDSCSIPLPLSSWKAACRKFGAPASGTVGSAAHTVAADGGGDDENGDDSEDEEEFEEEEDDSDDDEPLAAVRDRNSVC